MHLLNFNGLALNQHKLKYLYKNFNISCPRFFFLFNILKVTFILFKSNFHKIFLKGNFKGIVFQVCKIIYSTYKHLGS